MSIEQSSNQTDLDDTELKPMKQLVVVNKSKRRCITKITNRQKLSTIIAACYRIKLTVIQKQTTLTFTQKNAITHAIYICMNMHAQNFIIHHMHKKLPQITHTPEKVIPKVTNKNIKESFTILVTNIDDLAHEIDIAASHVRESITFAQTIITDFIDNNTQFAAPIFKFVKEIIPNIDIAALADYITIANITKKIITGTLISFDEIMFLNNMIMTYEKPRSCPLIDVHSNNEKIIMIGDIHGNLQAMIYQLMCGKLGTDKFVFLGDFVDRGNNSIEVLSLFFCLRLLFPNSVYGIRGNHEQEQTFMVYGFAKEICSRFYPHITHPQWVFGNDQLELTKTICIFKNWMNLLPYTAIINDKIVCVHGSIGKGWTRQIAENYNMVINLPPVEHLHKPLEPQEILQTWSDPHEYDGDYANPRGCGNCISTETIRKVCDINGFDFQIRAHQVVNKGYQIMDYDEQITSITVFGVPNYCGGTNNAAIAIYHPTGNLELASFSKQMLVNAVRINISTPDIEKMIMSFFS
ncbi:serine/threonine-protein phosphatase [Bodo saltans virus]|uniref:Serine/threonine-protein phosphatase n=1 Tax=Bodo saltans virus TaxID=2024608 RepID=A0A2H4UVV2_9VIRU|nr:serine/threonine-protein phosphatase [Bodo saltans virus]ATZ81051.1 serine/threonine-protein phosphatase [Bodo saltans virus]